MDDLYEIVVGIDGSPTAHRALAFAMDAADRHDNASVLAVHAYHSPSTRNAYAPRSPYLPAGTIERLATQESQARQDNDTIARQNAERVIHTSLQEVTPPDGAVVKSVAAARDAARTLIELSQEADLLVVGGRGSGGFRGLQVGSVSQKCLHHATCTVAVVR